MFRNILSRQILARPRLFFCLAIGIAVTFLLPESFAQRPMTRFILAWDTGVSLYLLLACQMMIASNHEKISHRARDQAEGQFVVLFTAVLSAIMSLLAIILELSIVKDMHGGIRHLHIGLASVTIFLSWIFTHTMFALHYAHDYYVKISEGKSGGLSFPGGDIPDYFDFIYFAYIIGTSGQTADVSFSCPKARRLGTLHCVLAFFFNTTVVALTINIASSLF